MARTTTATGGRSAGESFSIRITDTWTRPTDTNAYNNNDAISTTTDDTDTTALLGVDLCPFEGRPVILTYVRLTTNLDTFTITPRIRFWNVAQPTTAVAGDNAAFSRAYANDPSYLGHIDLPVMTDVGDCASSNNPTDRLELVPAKNSKTIYYRIECSANAATPSSGQSFTLDLRAIDAG